MPFEEEQDVNAESSPVDENNEQPASSDSNEAPASAEAAPKSEENVPFHMHPRFQEVIQEKNALKEQTAAFQRELAELKKQLQASTPAEKDELMERLESIDPKFAGLLKSMREELKSTKQQLSELSGWRQQSSAQSTAQQINSLKSDFYAQNKVPEDRRRLYEAQLAYLASSDPRLQQMKVSDLPKVLKEIHDDLGKMFTSVERNTTKQFVEGKKNEAARPAPLKPGVPAKAVKQDSQPLSRQELLAEMKRQAIEDARSNKDI